MAQEFSLNVIIVGAGLAGLGAAISCALAGHKVIVLEGARALAEIGAGLQITPNASRLLKEWGLANAAEEICAEPTYLAVHRYSDGKILAMEENFNQKMRTKYGHPFIDMHRVDLQKLLYNRAIELGVEVRLGARIKTVSHAEAQVLLESGATIRGDLVVGADGLWSRCRESFMGKSDAPLPTGDLAYRIVLELDQISDPELRELIVNPSCHFWIGPEAHAVGYSVRRGTMYNLVLLCPDNLPSNVSRQSGSVDEMKGLFTDWDPILTRLLNHVTSVDKWKLMHRAEVEDWTNEQGNFVLIGDSCHPMLPYLAQGANSALEDGAVLGRLLRSVKSKEMLGNVVRLYVKVRKARSEAIVRETFHQRHAFHMVNGPEQENRDELFKSQLGKEISIKFPSRWTCPEVQPWLYGYDSYKEADQALEQASFTNPLDNSSISQDVKNTTDLRLGPIAISV